MGLKCTHQVLKMTGVAPSRRQRLRTASLRRVFFRVHFWTGLSVGIYVLLISLSGSLIVFRRELDHAFCPTADCEPALVTGIARFHDDLLGGRSGLVVNGVGAVAVLVICVSGVVLWWPARGYWRRSVTIRRNVSGRRFVRQLHSVLGFWFFLMILLWAATGIYFAFPGPFNAMVDSFTAGGVETSASRFAEDAIAWLVRAHFGRFFGLGVKITWAILGLAPCVLIVTGTLMWWQRARRLALA